MPSTYRDTDQLLWSASEMVAFLKNDLFISRRRIIARLERKEYSKDAMDKAILEHFPLPVVDAFDTSFVFKGSSGSIYVELARCSIKEAIKRAKLFVFDTKIKEGFFPIETSVEKPDSLGRISLHLFRLQFQYTVRGEEAIQLMRQAGFRPATMIELISLLITQHRARETILMHNLIALGSKCGDKVPCAQKTRYERYNGTLSLVDFYRKKYPNVWRFLAAKI